VQSQLSLVERSHRLARCLQGDSAIPRLVWIHPTCLWLVPVQLSHRATALVCEEATQWLQIVFEMQMRL